MALGQFFHLGTPGNNGVECRVYVAISDQGDNSSIIGAELQFRKSNGFQSQGNSFGSMTIHGNGGGVTISGNKTLPSNGGWVNFGNAPDQRIYHGADGRAPYTEVRVNGVGISGSQDFDTPVSATLSFDSGNGFADYSRPPGQVSQPTVDQITPTSARINWTTPSTPVSISQYDLHVCLDTNFNGTNCPHYNWTGNANTNKVISGLNPGTTYYARVRAQSSEGEGAWSASRSFVTLPSTPPSLVVVPSPAGSAATVTLSPPSGIAGVDSYTVTAQYISPSPIPEPSTLTFTTTTNLVTATGLVAGATYAWSTTATIGGYTTPASTPQNVTQPKPNTSPGDFFDGNTTDTPDIDYAWQGTANNSVSIATGKGVTGWFAHFGAPASGATYQTTGGYAGDKAARVAFLTDATGPEQWNGGQLHGVGTWSSVEPFTTYIGSMHVNPQHRAQRLGLFIEWFNAAGVGFATSNGSAVVAPGDVWTRLSMSAVAPAEAENAVIRVADYAGEGFSPMLSGQSILLDAAMLSLGSLFPYFDGDTADTAEFDYQWTGTPNASVSLRNTLDTAGLNDPLNDPDCTDIPPSPRPPTVPSDCIEDVGLWRRYWAYIPAHQVSDWLTTIPTLIVSTFGAPERQVRIRYYADPFGRPSEVVNTEDFCSEQIVSYIPPSTEMTLDGVTERAWASVQGGASLAADHLLYGSGGTPAEWPRLSCGIGYWLSLDVPNDAPAGNLTVRVLATQRV